MGVFSIDKNMMSRTLFALLAFAILVITACEPATPLPNITTLHPAFEMPQKPTGVQTSSPTVPLSEVTNTSYPTPTPIPEARPTSTSCTTSTDIYYLCPVEFAVPLKDLGLDPTTRLVMLPSQAGFHEPIDTGYWVLTPPKKTPQYISSLAPDTGMVNADYSFSPDGKWVLFSRWEIDGDAKTVWLSSINGSEQWPVKEIDKFSFPAWVNGNEIVIVGINYDWNFPTESPPASDYMPLLIINPFTLEEKPLRPLPKVGRQRLPIYYFSSARELFAHNLVSYESDYEYLLYNYTNDTFQPVFSWMLTADYLSTDIRLLSDSTFVVSVVHPDSIDFSPKLNLKLISTLWEYQEIMQSVPLPEQFPPVYVWGVSSQGDLLLRENLKTEDNLNLSISQRFYVLDAENFEFRDYCLDVHQAVDLRFSPDGRFVALTFFENPNSKGGDTWIIVLDLETGYMTRIDGYQLVGWGKIEE